MKLTGKLVHARPIVGMNETEIAFDAYGQHAADLETYGDKVLDIEIKVHREKRSTRANNLCWELCSQIGRSITPPISKEEVYRQAIKDVGVFIQVCIRKGDYDDFDRQWRGRGTGSLLSAVPSGLMFTCFSGAITSSTLLTTSL